jgi:flavin-dependent dehydrogenase
VDAGVSYSSRVYRRPDGHDGDDNADAKAGPSQNCIYLQTKAPDNPRLGVVLPAEGGHWIVSLAGMRGGEPAPGEEGFARHIRQLRDTCVGDLLAGAEPVGPVRGFLPGPSLRRHYERRAPDGLVATGDAACTFNPCYGQGMSVAALDALALRKAAERPGGIGHATADAARSGIDRAAKAAWMLSSSEDVRFPATTGGPTGNLVRIQHRYIDRIVASATTSPTVTTRFLEVMSLIAEPSTLFRPAVLTRVLGGFRRH